MEPFDTRFLEFTLSSLALVSAVVRRMLITWVTLGNISLINLIKRFIFVMFRNAFTCNNNNDHAVNIHIFSLVHQLRLLLVLTFVPLPYLSG